MDQLFVVEYTSACSGKHVKFLCSDQSVIDDYRNYGTVRLATPDDLPESLKAQVIGDVASQAQLAVLFAEPVEVPA